MFGVVVESWIDETIGWQEALLSGKICHIALYFLYHCSLGINVLLFSDLMYLVKFLRH